MPSAISRLQAVSEAERCWVCSDDAEELMMRRGVDRYRTSGYVVGRVDSGQT